MNQLILNKNTTGLLLRVERSSLHDGQGLRTVVFLKGCPMNCAWCSTPESQQFEPEKGYSAKLCTACGRCIDVCPQKAIVYAKDKSSVITDKTKCRTCFTCFEVCPSNAIKKYGTQCSVEELVDTISRDEIFYFYSGGGVTVSGGEPLAQADFTAKLLKACKMIGINTAIETSLQAEYKEIEKLLPWLDTIYVDIKHMNPVEHEMWTGITNREILQNIRIIDQSEFPLAIVIRLPLVPGFNDGEDNLIELASFLNNLSRIRGLEILPYHRLGSDTYSYLERDYRCSAILPPDQNKLEETQSFLKGMMPNITIKVGSGYL
ncbi:MAG: glycyl-radical enzyme activating protein [Bacillota bacterium]|nr:glycyl-radical enzyme activating protein [Bacillota bacterium]